MEKTEPGNGKDAAKAMHAVIIPFPAQGHVTPCLQLAKRLVCLGFRITFVNTIHIHKRMMQSRSNAAAQLDGSILGRGCSEGGCREGSPPKNVVYHTLDTLHKSPSQLYSKVIHLTFKGCSNTCKISAVILIDYLYMCSKDIEFVAVSDGLPDDHPRLHELTTFFNATLQMGPEFEELLVNLLLKSSITCIIRDIILTAVHERAKKLGIPVMGFATPSAIAMQCMYHLRTLVSTGVLPLPPPPADAPTPSLNAVTLTLELPRSASEVAARQAPLRCLPGGSPTMRVDDIPTFLLSHDLESFYLRFFRENQNPLVPDCECILYNTFYALESDILDAMAGEMNTNVYAVGPLVLHSTPTSCDGVEEETSLAGAGSASLWEEDRISLAWLDHQTQKSVLFVSFGSVARVSTAQMQEFASGLELSGHAFLWVIRPDLIDTICADDAYHLLFSDFVVRTRDRALLVPWAPQTAVLSHSSVAAFLTHCGWNSTIESISSGVPMLGWPRFFDQTTNCHYITHVWKIGLRLQNQADADGTAVVLKDEVAEKVKKIMAPDKTNLEVDSIRTNSKNFKLAGRKAIEEGGSSQRALTKFVELIGGRTTYSPSPS